MKARPPTREDAPKLRTLRAQIEAAWMRSNEAILSKSPMATLTATSNG
jgi:hypothetical protein